MAADIDKQHLSKQLGQIQEYLLRIKDAARYKDRCSRMSELQEIMAVEGFWNDQSSANKTIAELKITKEIVDAIEELESGFTDTNELLELAIEEDDNDTYGEVQLECKQLRQLAESLELKTLLSGKYDSGDCYLSIQSGAGGTESCDWAAMLRRMFLRWAERNHHKVQTLEELPGEETGYKSVTLHVKGSYAYGYLSAEAGVHRLVRISPFDANSRRHTSFVSVMVSPEVEGADVEINESDLRIDTYRASGAGGQHVNTTDSAVRITHLPTNIVVQCQNERSQHSNRAAAMQVLQSRLVAHEEQRRQAEVDAATGEKSAIGFGSQIMNYVLAPYKMVKDRRTGHETGNVEDVLDGALDPFIEAYLRHKAKLSGQS